MRKFLLIFGDVAAALLGLLRNAAAGTDKPLFGLSAVAVSEVPGDDRGAHGSAAFGTNDLMPIVTRVVTFRHKEKHRGHRCVIWRPNS